MTCAMTVLMRGRPTTGGLVAHQSLETQQKSSPVENWTAPTAHGDIAPRCTLNVQPRPLGRRRDRQSSSRLALLYTLSQRTDRPARHRADYQTVRRVAR